MTPGRRRVLRGVERRAARDGDAGWHYPPSGTRWDSWDDDAPSQRAILIRALRETPTLLAKCVKGAKSWSVVIDRLCGHATTGGPRCVPKRATMRTAEWTARHRSASPTSSSGSPTARRGRDPSPVHPPSPRQHSPQRKPARCRRHVWALKFDYVGHEVRGGVAITTTGAIVHVAPGTKLMTGSVATNEYACIRCGHVRQPVASKRGRNNRKRGVSDELAVARLLGGEKIGPLGLPWDVVVPGYLRAQCKKTGRWPSLASVVAARRHPRRPRAACRDAGRHARPRRREDAPPDRPGPLRVRGFSRQRRHRCIGVTLSGRRASVSSWTASRNSGGYGHRYFQGRIQHAHRVAWQKSNGPIPDGLCVLHSCDNPPCVNPAHLWLGTQADNARDRDNKKRRDWSHLLTAHKVSGEEVGTARLTRETVATIRERYAAGGLRQLDLATEYGVSRSLVQAIVTGRVWADARWPTPNLVGRSATAR